MKQFTFRLNLAAIFWSATYGMGNGSGGRCRSTTSRDLIPLSNCKVAADNQRFLYASCNINCFARAPKPIFQGDLYTILVSVGYKSVRPLTSESESVCLWMTNITIEKPAKRYSPSYGTNFIFNLSDRLQNEIFMIQEGNIAIVYPKSFRRVFGIAHMVDLCNVSSSRFDISAADDKNNASCKVKIFGMKTDVFAAGTSQSSDPVLTMNAAKFIMFENAIILKLNLRFKPMREQQKYILDLIRNYNILQFEFIETHFHIITNRDFQKFSTLKVLNLTRGSIRAIQSRAFRGLRELSVLDLSYNKLHNIPLALHMSFLPKLVYLMMEGNAPSERNFTVTTDAKSPSLSSLDLSKVSIFSLENNCFIPFSKLMELYLKQCYISFIANGAFLELSSLSILSLAGNNLMSLSDNVFRPLVSLKYLNLGHNNIEIVSVNRLNSLKSLNLEGNQISEFPLHLPSSLRKVNLRANRIKSWGNSRLMNPSQLQDLDLSSNLITILTNEMQTDFNGIYKINMSMNPFNCTPCPLYRLSTWLRKQNVQSPNSYTCTLPSSLANSEVLNLSSDPEDCLIKTVSITMVCVLALIILLVIALLSYTVYFRRWSVRYYCLRLTSVVQDYRKYNAIYSYKDYDAFVSYAPSDRWWLIKELLPKLEKGEDALRLYIYDRDEVAGNMIAQNIHDSIERSHYVILVVSEAFIAEPRCQFEMYAAYQNLLEETIRGLVLVKVEDILPTSVSKVLNYLMKTRTYLEWPSSEDARQVFWERLKRFLNRTNKREEVFNLLV